MQLENFIEIFYSITFCSIMSKFDARLPYSWSIHINKVYLIMCRWMQSCATGVIFNSFDADWCIPGFHPNLRDLSHFWFFYREKLLIYFLLNMVGNLDGTWSVLSTNYHFFIVTGANCILYASCITKVYNRYILVNKLE